MISSFSDGIIFKVVFIELSFFKYTSFIFKIVPFISLYSLVITSPVILTSCLVNVILHDVKTKRLVRMHKIITNTDENTIIDHINRDKLDNRKENFRYATKSENRINSKTRTDNVSGIQGVRFEEGKWRVRISVDGKYVHLGMFNDFEEAVKTRLEAENKYYGEFAMQKNLFEKYGIT